MSKGLQQIDQDSKTHHETLLLEEIFTSSKSGTPEIPRLEKKSGIAIPRRMDGAIL